MNRKIRILIIFLLAVVILVLSWEYFSARVENRKQNIYKFDTSQFERVDTSLVQYSELRQISVENKQVNAINCFDDKIFLLHDSMLSVLDFEGKLLKKKQLNAVGRAIDISKENKIVIAFKNYIQVLNQNFEILAESRQNSEKSFFTSVQVAGDKIFVANAGNRIVLVFNFDLEEISFIDGKTEENPNGFIVPSPYFDIALSEQNLWFVNPGEHQLMHYSQNGNFISSWKKSSIEIDGFSGCCNPAHLAILPDGNLITSEKGMVRLKVVSEKGELKSVVATPKSFKDGHKAPDICISESGEIIALDFDKKLIRFFKKNDKR